MNKKSIKSAFPIIIIFLLLCSCSPTGKPAQLGKRFSPSALQVEISDDFDARKINRVVLYPLENASGGRIPPETLQVLTRIALGNFERETSVELVNGRDPERLATALATVAGERGPLQSRAESLGRAVSAQGVLYGIVSTFRERQGTRLGASVSPAISFTLWLSDVRTSEVLWTARYSREQKPLSENLLQVGSALKDGVGYKTSEQLSEIGFRDTARYLEKLRGLERKSSNKTNR